jgi:hypothetical protein
MRQSFCLKELKKGYLSPDKIVKRGLFEGKF